MLERERVLVFRVDEHRLAVSSSELIGVALASVCQLPLAESSHLGLMMHNETVVPVFDPLCMHGLGTMTGAPRLVIVMECRGCVLGLACHVVEGSAEMEPTGRVLEGGYEGMVGGESVVRLEVEAAVGRMQEG